MEQMAKELLAAQEEVQRRFARAMRTRKQSVLKHAHESLLSDRRSSAAALRAEMDRHSGRDVTRRLAGVEPAPEKEVVALHFIGVLIMDMLLYQNYFSKMEQT